MSVLSLAVLAVGLWGVADAGCYADPERAKQSAAENELIRASHASTNFDLSALAAETKNLPSNFNWCALEDGRSMCTPSWNQHIPLYCGSCWLHATLSSLMDRYNIMQDGKLPGVMMGRQTVLDCAPFYKLSDGCGGGDPKDVYRYMQRFGVPDETCLPYSATDYKKYGNESTSCPLEGYCINCMPTGDPPRKECWGIKNPVRYTVKEWGPVPRNADAIMLEVHRNGPVPCGISTYDDFDYNYRGGVWAPSPNATDVNHDVEIVGWGESEEEGKYWVIRNSWGTYWGEMGFFRIPRGVNAMQIESDCWWGVPASEDERLVRAGRLTGSMYGLVAVDPKLVGF